MRLALAAIAFVIGSPAYAMGGGMIRDLASTTAGECPGGKLMEHYFESGNVHGDSEAIQVVCLAAPMKASWLWMAATGCEGSKVCPRRRHPPAPFAYPAGHFISNRPDGQASPKTMTYNVKQAIRGTDCTLSSYQTEYEPGYYWSCTKYVSEYGTENLITVVTIGTTKQVGDYEDNAPNLPLHVTAPASIFTVDEATPLIDQE